MADTTSSSASASASSSASANTQDNYEVIKIGNEALLEKFVQQFGELPSTSGKPFSSTSWQKFMAWLQNIVELPYKKDYDELEAVDWDINEFITNKTEKTLNIIYSDLLSKIETLFNDVPQSLLKRIDNIKQAIVASIDNKVQNIDDEITKIDDALNNNSNLSDDDKNSLNTVKDSLNNIKTKLTDIKNTLQND